MNRSARLKIESRSDHWMSMVSDCLYGQVEEVWHIIREKTSEQVHEAVEEEFYHQIRQNLKP